jgi:hypothetical protein
VEKRSFVMRRNSDPRERLNSSDFVLAVQYGDDERPFCNGFANRFGINTTIRIDAHCCYGKSATRKELSRVGNCRMFHRGDHNVVPTVLTRKGQPLQRQVVGLAPAAREDDFVFLSADQFGGSVANSKSGEAAACVPSRSYAAMPKIVWMNWR